MTIWNQEMEKIKSHFENKKPGLRIHPEDLWANPDQSHSAQQFKYFNTVGWSCIPLAFRTLFLQASRSNLLFSRIFLSLVILRISPSRKFCKGPIMDSWPPRMYSCSISPRACSVWPTRMSAEPSGKDILQQGPSICQPNQLSYHKVFQLRTHCRPQSCPVPNIPNWSVSCWSLQFCPQECSQTWRSQVERLKDFQKYWPPNVYRAQKNIKKSYLNQICNKSFNRHLPKHA